MAFKEMMKSLIGKKETPVPESTSGESGALLTSEDFPLIPASDIDLGKYRKLPLLDIAALGASFSTLPETARTITKTVTTCMSTDTPVFVGLWPEGVMGKMVDKGQGFSGNILGKSGKIAGRMRYKLLDDGLPVSTTTSTVIPFDPMTLVVAAALMNIDRKLDALQEKAEEILRFLALEKQSKQRGNLNMLTEIMEEYKQDCSNEKKCALRVIAVQDIKREAHQDILFYQEQIGRKLKEQKAIHGAQNAQALLNNVMREFCEYQLASYLYAYTSFLEVMLTKDFSAAPATAQKLEACAQKYRELYSACRSQIAHYQRTAIEPQLIGGLGNAVKSVGQKLASVPVLSKGPVDEALISVGESLGKRNKDAVAQKLDRFAPLEDSRMDAFIDNIRTTNLLYSQQQAMLTDGENLYILEAA